ncbi:glycosyltransferase [Nocardioides mangrovicus]|uniref:glycosyltransferase n=1 Tax=Nocardioides mangrovicus TaxID=2478913 RepID=UPI0013144A9E|nr:glycosyltransferase [Nocardioides mangrovicus]
MAIFRSRFLPPSETFVRDQLERYRDVDALALADAVVPDGLRLVDRPVHLVDGAGLADRARSAALRLRGASERTKRDQRVARRLHRLDVDVLHAHFGPDAASVRGGAVQAGVPLVATFHGFDATVDFAHFVSAGGSQAQMVEDWSLLTQDVSAFVAVSSHIKDSLVARGVPEQRISVVPCGIDVASFDPTPVPDHGGLLFVGRLVEKKGLADLLQALSTIGEPPPLTVIGDGPLREDLEQLARELGVSVSFVGTAGTSVVKEAIKAARLVVMPSRTAASGDSEGLPVVALEAQASGRPVLAYAHSGLRDAVLDGRTGILVPEADVGELGRALTSMLGDSEKLAEMGRAARERVAERFDISTTIADLEHIYREVAAPSGPRSTGSSAE